MQESPIALLGLFLTMNQIAVYEGLPRMLKSGLLVMGAITSREADRSRT
jgi:hypothetical protein